MQGKLTLCPLLRAQSVCEKEVGRKEQPGKAVSIQQLTLVSKRVGT